MSPKSADDPFTYHLEPDETAAEGVIRAVAAITGTQPTELDSLFTAIDPDALNVLVHSATTEFRVEFRYHSYLVEITGDGVVIMSRNQ